MEDTDILIIARKSVKGIAALTSRTFMINVLQIAANFILTIYLSPGNYGVYFVVSAIVAFLSYFQDIGLAASLVQKKDEPTEFELRNVFTIQQILVLAIVIPVLIFSPQISGFYKLGAAGMFLLQAFMVSFFMSSLRTIPTILLERHLNFDKLVIPQIVENLVYYVALIVLVVTGFGINSFTIAVLLRGIVGLIVLYSIQPWRIGFAFSLEKIRELVTFGVPFQANSILALFKDDLLDVYIAKILPLAQVGYIGFAQKWAFVPLRLVMDNVIKVTFPSFSRLQHDKQALAKVVEKSLFLISVFIFPVVVSFIFFAGPFIHLFPIGKYQQKWEPALFALSIFSMEAFFASITVPLTNFLNAIGKIKITLVFMVAWTILTWALSLSLIHFIGYNGVAWASMLVAASGLGIVYYLKKYIKFSFFGPIVRPFIASLAMIGGFLALSHLITSMIMLVLTGIAVWVVYAAALFAIARGEIRSTFSFVLQSVRKE